MRLITIQCSFIRVGFVECRIRLLSSRIPLTLVPDPPISYNNNVTQAGCTGRCTGHVRSRTLYIQHRRLQSVKEIGKASPKHCKLIQRFFIQDNEPKAMRDQIVAQFTLRTYGVNQIFDFVKGIWFHKRVVKSVFFSKKTYFTSYVHNMF